MGVATRCIRRKCVGQAKASSTLSRLWHLYAMLKLGSRVRNSTVWYGTARCVFTFQKTCAVCAAWQLGQITRIRVRSTGAVYAYAAYFMLCSPDMELERSALVLSLFARSSRRRTCLSAPSYSSIILHKQCKLCEMRR